MQEGAGALPAPRAHPRAGLRHRNLDGAATGVRLAPARGRRIARGSRAEPRTRRVGRGGIPAGRSLRMEAPANASTSCSSASGSRTSPPTALLRSGSSCARAWPRAHEPSSWIIAFRSAPRRTHCTSTANKNTARRSLENGQEFEIVKVYYTPQQLDRELAKPGLRQRRRRHRRTSSSSATRAPSDSAEQDMSDAKLRPGRPGEQLPLRGARRSGRWCAQRSTTRGSTRRPRVAVCAAAVWLGVSRLDWVLLVLAMGAVWTAEGFNTAIELLADALSPERTSLRDRPRQGRGGRRRASECHRLGDRRIAGAGPSPAGG